MRQFGRFKLLGIGDKDTSFLRVRVRCMEFVKRRASLTQSLTHCPNILGHLTHSSNTVCLKDVVVPSVGWSQVVQNYCGIRAFVAALYS